MSESNVRIIVRMRLLINIYVFSSGLLTNDFAVFAHGFHLNSCTSFFFFSHLCFEEQAIIGVQQLTTSAAVRVKAGGALTRQKV